MKVWSKLDTQWWTFFKRVCEQQCQQHHRCHERPSCSWTFLLAAEATARYKISQDDNHARIIVFFECKIHEMLFWTRAPDKSGQHAGTQPPSGFFFLRFLRISSQVSFRWSYQRSHRSHASKILCFKPSPVSKTLATWGSSSPLEMDK